MINKSIMIALIFVYVFTASRVYAVTNIRTNLSNRDVPINICNKKMKQALVKLKFKIVHEGNELDGVQGDYSVTAQCLDDAWSAVLLVVAGPSYEKCDTLIKQIENEYGR